MTTREARITVAVALALAWMVAAQFVNGLALLLLTGIGWLLAARVEFTDLPDGIAQLEAYANQKGTQ